MSGIKDEVGCIIPECEVAEDIVARKSKIVKGKKAFVHKARGLTFFILKLTCAQDI